MSKLSSTNEMLSCRQRAASDRCEATAPSLRRARWNPQHYDGNSGHVPSTKKDHGATLSRNRTSRVTKRHDSKHTFPGFGMTHSMERLLTTSADSQRRVDSKQAVMAYLVSVRCEPAGGLYPSASYFSAQESRPHEKQPQASWYGPRTARTTSWGTAKLFRCAIVVGSRSVSCLTEIIPDFLTFLCNNRLGDGSLDLRELCLPLSDDLDSRNFSFREIRRSPSASILEFSHRDQ